MAEQNQETEVVLRRYNNAFDAEMALHFLREHDIKARLRGTGGTTLLDRFTTVTDLCLMVHERDAKVARDALAAMDMPADPSDPRFSQHEDDLDAAHDEHDESPYRASRAVKEAANAAQEGRSRDRRSRIGAIAGVCIPGGGHIYARQPWTGLVFFVFVTLAFTFATSLHLRWLALAGFMILSYDVLHAVIAIDQHNLGNDPPRRTQLAHGALAVCIASGASLAIDFARNQSAPEPAPASAPR